MGTTNALVREATRFAGRIVDVDSHEMMPAQEWVKVFGGEVREIADYFITRGEGENINLNTPNIPGYPGDVAPVDENIVNIKGSRAPGATDPRRRLEVMDAMGIGRQLMYPTGLGLFTLNLYKFADDHSFMSEVKGDRLAKAKRWLDLYNEWTVGAAAISERIRPVALLYGDTPAELIERARSLMKRGIRALWLFPAGELPGGRSPAHPDLDPLWAMIAEARCVLTVHVGGDGKFLNDLGWREAPAFKGFVQLVELSGDPWFLSTMHLAYENILSVMVTGGVFERHPELRFGAIEAGSYWLGPLCHRLDMWYGMGNNFTDMHDPDAPPPFRLKHPPSYYIKRNVRVTPYVFENFAADIAHYDIADTLCFSTDYPHTEGGKGALKKFYKHLEPLGEEMIEKFFVKNGQWLLPD